VSDERIEGVLLELRCCLAQVPLRRVEAFCGDIDKILTSEDGLSLESRASFSLLETVAEVQDIDVKVFYGEMRRWVGDLRMIEHLRLEAAEREHQPFI